MPAIKSCTLECRSWAYQPGGDPPAGPRQEVRYRDELQPGVSMDMAPTNSFAFEELEHFDRMQEVPWLSGPRIVLSLRERTRPAL